MIDDYHDVWNDFNRAADALGYFRIDHGNQLPQGLAELDLFLEQYARTRDENHLAIGRDKLGIAISSGLVID